MDTTKNEAVGQVLEALESTGNKTLDTLTKLKPEVTPEDKIRVALKYRVNVRTIERYLNGEVAKEHFAKDIISDFRRIISKRKRSQAA